VGKLVFSLEYLPAAMRDMAGIVRYVSIELHNPDAADWLAVKLFEAGERLNLFYTPSCKIKQFSSGIYKKEKGLAVSNLKFVGLFLFLIIFNL